jgi:hypothetical protein
VSRLRWLWPAWWAVVAVAAFFTRDDPPPFWWVFPGALALASWAVELQESTIRDLLQLLGREQARAAALAADVHELRLALAGATAGRQLRAVPGPVPDEELLAVADAAGVLADPAVDGSG